MIRTDLDPLILDLLEWIGREPRTYADVIDAWRTSCPRLTVWEDAMDRGFAVREHAKGREVMIRLTAAGRDFLREHGWSAAKSRLQALRFPGAMQHEVLLRRTGIVTNTDLCTAPALRRTATRCA